MTDLCREFGISRKTGYKYRKRWQEMGLAGLFDASRRPYRSPNRTPQDLVDLVVAARMRRPTWGPKKLLWLLDKEHPGVRLPAVSTIGVILRREGLVTTRRRRRRAWPTTGPLREAMAPNDVWAMDFKGQFRTGKSYCYPFTISDQYSRYLLGCEGLDGTQGGPAQAVLAAVFREFGLPEVIRSDNGSPFASTGRHGLTRLAVWLIRQGISLERIEPGRPDQNGRHERMHRTLKAETTRPACSNLLAQQERFDDFRKYYNESRPHEALGMRPPAEVYEPSDRSYQEYLEPLTYPLHDITTIVTEDGKAYISPFKKRVYIGGALAGETVGIRELDDGCWIVHFSDIELGLIDINLGGLLVITTNPSQTPAPRR